MLLVEGGTDVAASRSLISAGVNCKLVRFWAVVSGVAGDMASLVVKYSPHGECQQISLNRNLVCFLNFLAVSFVSFNDGGRHDGAHIMILSNSPDPCLAKLWARNAMGFSCIPPHLG